MSSNEQDRLKEQDRGRIGRISISILRHELVLIDNRVSWVNMGEIRLYELVSKGLLGQCKSILHELVVAYLQIPSRDLVAGKVIHIVIFAPLLTDKE